jgi:hypothetical protein
MFERYTTAKLYVVCAPVINIHGAVHSSSAAVFAWCSACALACVLARITTTANSSSNNNDDDDDDDDDEDDDKTTTTTQVLLDPYGQHSVPAHMTLAMPQGHMGGVSLSSSAIWPATHDHTHPCVRVGGRACGREKVPPPRRTRTSELSAGCLRTDAEDVCVLLLMCPSYVPRSKVLSL